MRGQKKALETAVETIDDLQKRLDQAIDSAARYAESCTQMYQAAAAGDLKRVISIYNKEAGNKQ